MTVDLSNFSSKDFNRGRSAWIEALWLVAQAVFISSWIPGSRHRVWLLRLFGAEVGTGVTLKPFLRVKFPWRLSVGDYSWIGESVWIDNLVDVRIGRHVCISQGAYLCTGSHDWSASDFALLAHPVRVEDHAWVCAQATLAPGTEVGEGVVIALRSVASGRLLPWNIYSGSPAVTRGKRIIRNQKVS